MALNGKPPGRPKVPPKVPAKEISDEAFERIASKAIDAPVLQTAARTRVGQGREKGKGYAMGNKKQITHMITDELLADTDAEAARCGEARATVINRAIREHLARVKAD